jgi:hypothetical protein
MLQWDLLTIQQFLIIAQDIYARLNARVEHDLEGWDERYVPAVINGMRTMRRMSPMEVWRGWRGGASQLKPISDEAMALLLVGTSEGSSELTTRSGMFTLTNSEISGDRLRFDARALPDREKFLVVVNPFKPDAAFAFDARRRFVAKCPRIWSADMAEIESVHRACGEAAKREAEMLTPLRARHLQEAREKTARHARNAGVLHPETPEDKAVARRQAKRAGSIDEFCSAEPADDSVPVELPDAADFGAGPSGAEPSATPCLGPEDFLNP